MTKIACVDAYGKQHIFEEKEYVHRPAVYGMLIKNSELLLVKDAWGKRWGLPGGGIDANETPKDALIREFREETGLIIANDPIGLSSDISYFLADNENHPWKTHRTIYKVDYTSGQLQEKGNNIDVIEVKYFPLEVVKNLDLQANTWSILEKLFSQQNLLF